MALATQIHDIVTRDYVYGEEVARILALAFEGRKNLIIFGPAGHAKSAIIEAVIKGMNLEGETFTQFFGEGMDEARLFGGLNFRKLEDEKVLEYYPERSFLNSRVAVFEELFDAPATVLLALKDTLTARELRNGAQRFPMKTEVIICLTNREPSEISQLGPAAHALIERFPLQINHKWKDYSARTYLQMLTKVGCKPGLPDPSATAPMLAELVAKATANGQFVSPRTAVHALNVCQAAAALRGSATVEKQDFADLRFVPGLEKIAEHITTELRSAAARAEAAEKLATIRRKLTELREKLTATDSAATALKAGRGFERLVDALAESSVPAEFVGERDALKNDAEARMEEARQIAWNLTAP